MKAKPMHAYDAMVVKATGDMHCKDPHCTQKAS